jgi:hypothetical protein
LLLPGDQTFSRANFGANGQLLWAWDQALGHLDSDLEFEWILDASAESGLDSRTISYTVSETGEIYAIGQTSDYGAGDIDLWLCEYSCEGAVVSNAQAAFGSGVDDPYIFLFNDVHQNQSFDLVDTSGEAHVLWLNGVHIPDPTQPTDFHAIVGRIDAAEGTAWVRTADLDGGFFLTSRSFDRGSLSMASRNTGAGFEGYLVQLDTAGDVQWELSTNDGYDIFAMSGRLRLADDRILITGYSEAPGDRRRAIVIAVGPSGPEWTLSIAEAGDTFFTGAVQLPGGDIVAYGTVNVSGGSASRALFVRLDTDGVVVTQCSYGDDVEDYEIEQFAYMPDGTLAVLASIGTSEYWVASINQGGIIQWENRLSTDSVSGAIQLELVDPSRTESYTTSRVVVIGKKTGFSLVQDQIAIVFETSGAVHSALSWTSSHAGSLPTVQTDEATGSLYLYSEVESASGPGAEDALLVRYDSTMNFVWSHIYGGTGDDKIRHLDFNADGEILVSGLTDSFDAFQVDPFLLGLGLDGETTESCWVHDVTPSTFAGIASGTSFSFTLTMLEETIDFITVDLLETPTFVENTASHTISSPTATLDDC